MHGALVMWLDLGNFSMPIVLVMTRIWLKGMIILFLAIRMMVLVMVMVMVLLLLEMMALVLT